MNNEKVLYYVCVGTVLVGGFIHLSTRAAMRLIGTSAPVGDTLIASAILVAGGLMAWATLPRK